MNTIEKELKKLDNVMIRYISALKVLETQLEIINDDFKYIKKYNPIEHIKTRIKKPESIIKKVSIRVSYIRLIWHLIEKIFIISLSDFQ